MKGKINKKFLLIAVAVIIALIILLFPGGPLGYFTLKPVTVTRTLPSSLTDTFEVTLKVSALEEIPESAMVFVADKVVGGNIIESSPGTDIIGNEDILGCGVPCSVIVWENAPTDQVIKYTVQKVKNELTFAGKWAVIDGEESADGSIDGGSKIIISDNTPGDGPGGGPGSSGGFIPQSAPREKKAHKMQKITKSKNPEEIEKIIEANENIKSIIAAEFGKQMASQADIEKIAASSSEIIKRVSEPTRTITAKQDESVLSLSLSYEGAADVEKLVIYDTIPKTFAESADDIVVTAPGARVTVVENDPVFAFMYDGVTQGQNLNVNYTINDTINTSVLNQTTSPIIFADVRNMSNVINDTQGISNAQNRTDSNRQAMNDSRYTAPEIPDQTMIIAAIVIAIIAALGVVYFLKMKKRKK
ncbi:MAG: hypothetical protein ISS36_03965 [Candidatus Aenigmarchaeota archaeon]|nr:hypothetical protein [Candidatus Aenigmarchaeota archaeon]